MYKDKRVLLIAGGGTLGTYVSEELLRLGATVEVICPEDKVSNNERLIFHQSLVSEELLKDLFAKKHYHGIVNFIHYKTLEEYQQIHPLLIENTDHLIFLSSYRVYADVQHPITETAPRLLDVETDRDFLERETYAIPKAKCEDYLRTERAGEPWTIIRPVISSSDRRLDLLMYSGHRIPEAADKGEELLLPEFVRNYTAGFDWAGNSGKLIAHLLFKPETFGDTYTIYSGHGMTWGDVAAVYQKLTGVKIRWCSEEEYMNFHTDLSTNYGLECAWKHDRHYNRDVDCSKVLKATGLTADDFVAIEEGLRRELKKLGRDC